MGGVCRTNLQPSLDTIAYICRGQGMGCGKRCSYLLPFVFVLLVLCWVVPSIFCTWKILEHTQGGPDPTSSHYYYYWTPPVKLVSCKSLNLKNTTHGSSPASQPASQPLTNTQKTQLSVTYSSFFRVWNKFFFKKKYFWVWLSWCSRWMMMSVVMMSRELKSMLYDRQIDEHSSNYIMIFNAGGCLQNIVNHSNNHVRCVSLVARLGLGWLVKDNLV
jgi:hypothetical protein